MKKIIKLFSILVFLLGTFSVGQLRSVDSPFYTNTNPSWSAFGASVRTWGFSFSPTVNMKITALGHLDIPTIPMSTNRQVGFWTDNGLTGTLLGSVIVTPSSTLVSGYRYVTLSTPINLTAGTFYRIGALETSGSMGAGLTSPGPFYWANGFILDSRISNVVERNNGTATFDYPSINSNSTVSLNVSAMIAPLPEPGTYLMLGSFLGMALLGVAYKKHKALKV